MTAHFENPPASLDSPLHGELRWRIERTLHVGARSVEFDLELCADNRSFSLLLSAPRSGLVPGWRGQGTLCVCAVAEVFEAEFHVGLDESVFLRKPFGILPFSV